MTIDVTTKNSRHELVVAFEGNVCAGKSTISNALTKMLSCDRYCDYMDSLPFDHPAKSSLLPAEQRLKVFLALESNRLDSWLKRSRPCVLLDRSVLSIIAFEYAMRHLGKTTAMLDRANDLTPESIVPEVAIWLKSDIATAKRRWRMREGVSSPIYINERFGSAIDTFYRIASKHILTYELDTERYAADVLVDTIRETLISTRPEANPHALSNLIREAFG